MATSLRLPPNLEADIKQLAEEHERSEHAEIITALREYVSRHKEIKKVAEHQACVICVGLLENSEETNSALEHLRSLFSYVDCLTTEDQLDAICANPKNGLSYEEAFIICQRRYYDVGWVYADSVRRK
jgi:predicted transcriptional regulator